MAVYRERYIETTLLTVAKTFKALYLGGPRQSGKTTLLLRMAQKHNLGYVTLDNLSDRELALEDPYLFLETHTPPVVIDEVQYAPQLFPLIKARMDQSARFGLYWLSGSQHFSTIRKLQESLAGRIAILSLLGYSLGELRDVPRAKQPFFERDLTRGTALSAQKIFSIIHRGSFPALWRKAPPPAEMYFNSYIQTYVDRDLVDLFHISRLSEFHVFLRLCAARTGQMLNLSELARDTGISVPAAKGWVSILESMGHIMLLRPYYQQISKRLIKAPKLYFLDTGLAAHLTKWPTADALMNGAMAGAFFETFVVSEIMKSYLFRGLDPSLYYVRDKEGHEIDILFDRRPSMIPVEVKMSGTPRADDAKNIMYFQKRQPKTAGRGFVISLIRDPFPLTRTVTAIPVSSII